MNGGNLLVDTNICLYLLSGNETISEILDGNTLFNSFITQLELLSYPTISDIDTIKIQNL